MAANPWIEPFRQALGTPNLAERLHRSARPIACSGSPALGDIRGELNDRLGELHVACGQETALVREALRLGMHHAKANYPSTDEYRRRRYLKDPYVNEPVVRALTGDSGVGKSEMLDAIRRLLGDVTMGNVGGDFGEVRVTLCVSIRISLGIGLVDVMNQIAEAIGLPLEYKRASRSEILHLRRQLYAAGVCLLLVDELQFITSSSTANAVLTRLLYLIQRLGIAAVFAINYSGGHLLMRRPEQDRQRFLTKPMILLPAVNEAMVDLLKEYKRVLGKALAIDPKRDAAKLNYWSGGKKRLLKELLDCACSPEVVGERGVGPITLKTIEVSYNSVGFSACRKIVLESLKSDDQKGKAKDLICPFELPMEAAANLAKRAGDAREAALHEAVALEAMPLEKKARIVKARKALHPSPSSARRPRATDEDLVASCPS